MRLSLTKIRQHFPRTSISDVEGTVRAQPAWQALLLKPGARIAVAVGSRGIADIDRIAKATVSALQARGAKPFIIPAMGSHGGATAEGQRGVLASLGVTEGFVRCPIHSSMDVVQVHAGDCEVPLFMDRSAFEADGIVLINRIKVHTDFHGRYESGLVKMAVIGLGKEPQALAIHRHGVRGLKELVPRAAEKILRLGKILCGVAIIENAHDETLHIEALPGGKILEREPELLELARRNMPRLPVDALDVLIVDRMGKEISGGGMDTNIIGRIKIPGEPEPAAPSIKMIIVSDLTENTHGNATGMGLADVTTRRFFEKIDFAVTNKNIYTSSFLERGKVPMVADTDAQAYDFALRGCGAEAAERPRVLRIRDTLHLGELYASPAVIGELAGRAGIKVAGEPVEQFDADGCLRVF